MVKELFRNGPIMVQRNLKHSQAKPYGICNPIIYLTQTHISCISGTSHREAESTIFGMTQPQVVGTLDLPNSKPTLYHHTTHDTVHY